MNLKSFCTGFLVASCIFFSVVLATSCGNGSYDMEKYKSYRNNGELSDVVHEWMHAYIEEYCRVQRDGSIECE